MSIFGKIRAKFSKKEPEPAPKPRQPEAPAEPREKYVPDYGDPMLYSIFDLTERRYNYHFLLDSHLRTARYEPPADFPAPADRSDDVGVAMRILALHGEARAKLIYRLSERDPQERNGIEAIFGVAADALSRADIPFATVARWRLSENYFSDNYPHHYDQFSDYTFDFIGKLYHDVLREAQTRLVTAPLDALARDIANSHLVGPLFAEVSFRAFHMGLSRRAIEASLALLINQCDGQRIYDLCLGGQAKTWDAPNSELYRLLQRQRSIPKAVHWGLFWWPLPFSPQPRDLNGNKVFWPCKAALDHAANLPQWQERYAKELADIRESLISQTESDLKAAGYIGNQQ